MTPRIVAAAGAALGAPENTFAAAHAAACAGADMVEVDIRQSRDGVLYLMRDATVGRTTDGRGPLAALDAAAVDALDAGARFDDAHAGEPVPRLDRFLAALRGRLDFCLTLHAADPWTVAHLVRGAGLEARCLLMAADPALDRPLGRAAPWLVRAVDWPTAGGARAVRDSGARIVRLTVDRARPERLEAARAAGLEVMIDATGVSATELAAALCAGPRCLLTDAPAHAQALRRQTA